jgi:hypothetical protein
MSVADENLIQEDGVTPRGDHTAWALPNGTRAQVRNKAGKVVKRFTGEMAWADAVRHAGDLNAQNSSS